MSLAATSFAALSMGAVFFPSTWLIAWWRSGGRRDTTELSKQRVLEKHSRVWPQSNWMVYFQEPQSPGTIPYILCHFLHLILGSKLAWKSPKEPETRAPVANLFSHPASALGIFYLWQRKIIVRQLALPCKFDFRILPCHDALMMMKYSEWEGMVVQWWVKMVLITPLCCCWAICVQWFMRL